MEQDGLFSIIVLHYNQAEYYKTALDSVFHQDYGKIELIFADDCTPHLDVAEIENYIVENKKENIINYDLQINSQNMGTVKNVNEAIRRCHGEYVMFFAADDSLYDDHTISNFVKNFHEMKTDEMVLASQCYMYDEKLEEELECFVDPTYGRMSNDYTPWHQYEEMALRCTFAIGATAFRKKCFEKYGMFDETYKIIEDWSYWLRLTREGGKITYRNFGGLKHRDGGVSHYKETNVLPPHVKAYKLDMLNIQEKEVLPYISKMPIVTQQALMHKYELERADYYHKVGKSSRMRRIDIFKKSPKLFVRLNRLKFEKALEKLRLQSLKTAFFLAAVWFVLSVALAVPGVSFMLLEYSKICGYVFGGIVSLLPVLLGISVFVCGMAWGYTLLKWLLLQYRVYFGTRF